MREGRTTRNSKQRELITGILAASHEHPTAEDVYAEAKKAEPKISLGTVYRNLSLLAEQGVIDRLSCADGPDRYDFKSRPHAHFTCRICGRVSDIEIEDIESIGERSDGLCGYEIEDFSLSFFGVCPKCRQAK